MDHASNLESAEVFRRWTAITAIAAVLEQKVWLTTSDKLYPNLYTILVGHPGVGKTRTIMAGRKFLVELPEFHIAPTSMKMASLVDSLLSAKRVVISLPKPALEYNSMALLMDEWTAFMHTFDDELVGGLSQFYDCWPYEQKRRTSNIHIKIPRPQLTILAGDTPGHLTRFMPDFAWDQGFASRIILIYSSERTIGDDFAAPSRALSPEMIHDLKIMYALQGEFEVTAEYRAAVSAWRAMGEIPKPSHPKLLHYNTRRRTHIYKLSMVYAIDRGNTLRLLEEDFFRARKWLEEAEVVMANIFEEGTQHLDARLMDELVDWLRRQGKVTQARLVHQTSRSFPNYAVVKVIDLLAMSGRIEKDEKGMFSVTGPSSPTA